MGMIAHKYALKAYQCMGNKIINFFFYFIRGKVQKDSTIMTHEP